MPPAPTLATLHAGFRFGDHAIDDGGSAQPAVFHFHERIFFIEPVDEVLRFRHRHGGAPLEDAFLARSGDQRFVSFALRLGVEISQEGFHVHLGRGRASLTQQGDQEKRNFQKKLLHKIYSRYSFLPREAPLLYYDNQASQCKRLSLTGQIARGTEDSTLETEE